MIGGLFLYSPVNGTHKLLKMRVVYKHTIQLNNNSKQQPITAIYKIYNITNIVLDKERDGNRSPCLSTTKA